MTVVDGSRDRCGRPAARIPVILATGLGLVLTAAGCGGGGNGSMPPPQAMVMAPAILVQPMNQSIPMGLAATYSVSASGTSLQYQWAKNGAAIAGATGSAYTTPPVAFTDTGASFTVTVSNSGGAVSSRAAALTVTARAPAAGDLRFQQVDAASTVNGYGNIGAGLATNIPGRGAFTYSPALGSPLYVGGTGDCVNPPQPATGIGCAWFYSITPLGVTGLTAGYVGDLYANFSQDLQYPSPLAFGTANTPVSPASVITSLDLEPPNALFALSWVQSPQESGFDMTLQTVSPGDLQAAATQAGASGQVITAVSNNGGQITFLAYVWRSDTATAYEAQVVTASPANAPTAAAGLAASGYIITATGLADSAGDVLLIGTRVQGDTLPRPFVIAQNFVEIQTMQQEGYALVGVIVNLAQPVYVYSYLGER